jgi:hypothetical protein
MAIELIGQTGYDQLSNRREAWSLWALLQERLRLMETAVLWIDEAHDLFCADRNLILRAIKTLMQGDNAVVVILSGTEALEQVIRTDPQVQRRFSTMHWGLLQEAVDGESFSDLIASYCERAGLHAPNQGDLIARVFHASRYRFGRAIELTISAIEMALRERDEQLMSDHFASAWAMQEGCPADGNVFWAQHWWLIKPDDPYSEASLLTSKRRKRRA